MTRLLLLLLTLILVVCCLVECDGKDTDTYQTGFRVAIQRGETQRQQTENACVRNNTPGWCYPALPWYDQDGKRLSASFDSNGRLLSITNAKNKKLPLRYDTFGRLTSPDLYDSSGDVLATDAS